jgi:hypothetical protein
MTRYAPLWQQSGTYPASTDRRLLATLWPASTVTGGTCQSVNNTMVVAVAPGTALVALTNVGGGQTVLCTWDATENTPPLANPPASGSRIDLIVLQVRDQVVDGTGAGGNNDFIFQSVTGTPSTGVPVVPTTPANAVALAQVTITTGIANLNGVTYTDVRPMGGPQALAGPKWPAVPFVSGFQSRTDNDGVVWVAKGGVNGGQWTPATNILGGRAYRNGAWTQNTGNVAMDTFTGPRTQDPFGCFQVPGAVGVFTVPLSGTYAVNGALSVNSTANGQAFVMLLNQNGAPMTNGVLLISTAGAQLMTSTGNDQVACLAGSYIACSVGYNPFNLAGGPNAYQCYLAVQYLHP